MLANAETKWAILAVVDALIGHIANGQLNEATALFAEDADVALFGSDASDTALGWRAIRVHLADIFAKPFRVQFDLPERRISAAGNVAWFVGEGSYRLTTGDEVFPYRLALVLERRQGRWMIQLFDGSEPRQN